MEIRLLGLVEASHDGHAVPLGGAKPRALLAMLALHANAPVSADRLIEGLWGERPPATAPKLGAGARLPAAQAARGRRRGDRHARARLRAARGPRRRRRAALRAPADVRGERRARRARRSRCGAGRRSTISPTSRSPRPRSGGSRSCGCGRARPRSTPRWPTGATRRCSASSTSWSASIRCASGCTASACSRCIAAAARRRRWRPSGTPAGAARRGRARAGSRAAAPQRRDPRARTRSSTVRRRAPLAGPRRGGAHGGCSPPPPPWRSPAAVALGVTQLAGSDGLGRDRRGRDRRDRPRRAGTSSPQYPVGHAPDALAAGGGSVWIANGRDGTVSRVDRGHGQVTTIDVGGEPTALAFGDGSLWVADGQNRRVDQIDSAHEPRRPPPAGGQRAARRGGRAAARSGSPRRSTVRSTGSTSRTAGRIRRIEVPGGPAAIAAGGGAVWVASEEDGVVTKLDPRSGAVAEVDRGRQRAGRDRRRLRRRLGRQPRRRHGHADRRGDRRGQRHGARRRQPGRGRRRTRRDLGGRRRHGRRDPHRPADAHA